MDFEPSEYVQRGSPEDRFRDSEARIGYCRICGVPLLLRSDERGDCLRHLN